MENVDEWGELRVTSVTVSVLYRDEHFNTVHDGPTFKKKCKMELVGQILETIPADGHIWMAAMVDCKRCEYTCLCTCCILFDGKKRC